jgi:hypothetical protein
MMLQGELVEEEEEGDQEGERFGEVLDGPGVLVRLVESSMRKGKSPVSCK